MRKRWIYFAPLAIAAFILFIALGGVIVQLLWNWLLPPLFSWPQLTFLQALALLALTRILFGGFGGRGGPRSHMRRRMAERWDAMTPEERDALRQRMRDRCGEPS